MLVVVPGDSSGPGHCLNLVLGWNMRADLNDIDNCLQL